MDYQYSDSSSSASSKAVQPGPWLEIITLSYLLLVLLLLYPITAVVRCVRRSRKSLSRARRRIAAAAATTCTMESSGATTKNGSPVRAGTPDTSFSNDSQTELLADELQGRNSPTISDESGDGGGYYFVATNLNDGVELGDGHLPKRSSLQIEMPVVNDNTDNIGSHDANRDAPGPMRRSSSFLGLGRALRRSTSGTSHNSSSGSSCDGSVQSIQSNGSVWKRSKEAASKAARAVKKSARNRSRRGSGVDDGSKDRSGLANHLSRSDRRPKRRTAGEDSAAAVPSPVICTAFASRGRRRRAIITTQLAAKSRNCDEADRSADIFLVDQEEAMATNNAFDIDMGCAPNPGSLSIFGHVEIGDESIHPGDELGWSPYESYEDGAAPAVDEDDIVEYGAYDDYGWNDLPSRIREAAIGLGYSQPTWDGGEDVATSGKYWDELTDDEQEAATQMGYNKAFWDAGDKEPGLDVNKLNDAVRGLETFRAVLKFDKESKEIAKIAAPATIETLFSTLLGSFQIAVISKYIGSDALAVYAVVDFALSLTSIIGSGIGGAEQVMVSQAVGLRDCYQAGTTVQVSVVLYMLVATPVYILWIFFIDDLILFFGLGEDIARLGRMYLPILTLSHFVHDGFANALGGLMRIDGKTWQMAVIDTIFSILHVTAIVVATICFDFDLIGIAWIEVGSSLLYAAFMYSFCAYRGWLAPYLKGLLDLTAIRNGKQIVRIIKLAVPLSFAEFLAHGEWNVLTLYAAYTGDISAWAIAGAIWEFFEYAPEGISSAAIIRIGYLLGQTDPKKAKLSAYKCLLFGFLWSAFLSTIFLSQSSFIISLFTDDADTVAILERIVFLIGVGNCVMCVGNLAWSILSAQSRPKIASLVYGGVGVLCTCLPLASYYTFYLHLNIEGLVSSVVISYASVSLVLLVFVFLTNWTKCCCRIISALSGQTFQAVDDDSYAAKGRRWEPVSDGSANENRRKGLHDSPEEFILRKEIQLT